MWWTGDGADTVEDVTTQPSHPRPRDPDSSEGPGTPLAGAVTPAREQLLKVLWGLEMEQGLRVTNSLLAQHAGLHTSTVSDAVRRMAEDGFVEHHRYGAVALTSAGEQIAVQVVRRHRLLETFLVSSLDYTWDEVHEEADVLEHVASDKLIERIDEKLGHPSRDPHGDPIPDSSGRLPALSRGTSIVKLEPGATAVVNRIRSDDAELLRYFSALGMGPGARVEILVPPPFTRDVRIRIDGGAPVVLGEPAAEEVLTDPIDGPRGRG